MSTAMIPKLLSLHELADLLGEDLNTVRQRASRQVSLGRGLGMPVVQPTGSRGRRYVREPDLAAMVNRNAGQPLDP